MIMPEVLCFNRTPGLHLVHVLTARSARSEGVPFDLRRIDMDLDAVVHHGEDIHTDK